MNWLRTFSSYEYGIIAVFLLLYFYFFFKVWRLGKILTRPSRLIFIKFGLRSLYLALFVIALLGPSFGSTESKARAAARDIHLIIDMSASMKSSDLSPSRADKVKIELINLVNDLRTNRFSIMVFSNQAHWQIPLTFDLQLIKDFLQGIRPDLMPAPGSNVNAPLALLNNYAENSTPAAGKESVIWVTDGDFYSEPDPTLLQSLKSRGFQLFILAVGTETGGPVSITEEGNVNYSSMNKAMLSQLAEELGTRLFYLNDERNDLPQIGQQIKQTGYSMVTTQKEDVSTNKYSNFLLAGILLVMTDFLINIKLFKL